MRVKALKQEDIHLLKRAFKYIVPYKGKFICTFLCIFSGIGVGLIGPLLWGRVLNSLFQKNLTGAINNIMYSLILNIVANVISYFQSYNFSTLNQNIIFDLKQDMYKSMLNLPIKAYDDIDNGEFISRLHGDTTQVANVITSMLLNYIVDVIRLIVVGVTIFSINIKLSLIIIIAFPISLFISDRYGKKIRNNNEKLAKLNDQYFSNTSETIEGIREVKSLGIKEDRFKIFIELANRLKVIIVEGALLNTKSQTLSNIVSVIAQMTVMLIGSILIVKDSLEIPYFIAFNVYINQFSSSLLSVSKINLDLQQVMNSLERIFFLIDGLSYLPEEFGVNTINNSTGNIRIQDVSFRYNEDQDILNNITMDIQAKSRIAIVGSSGSGKTTIFNLLLKLYEPTRGKIFIDNIELNQINEKDLRRYISIVRQEPFLFLMSIRENLLLANKKASQQDLESACRKACIHDFIDSLPNKYETILGENGITLSGGQKQRIAIARALLKKSKIILLDEATSSLDNESQFYIKKAIDTISKDCTVMTIAHRLSTIIESDVIYVMNKGEIVGVGNHQSLMRTNDIYKELYKAEIDLIRQNCKEVI